MKYCSKCNKQYYESWVTFCSDDGTVLTDGGLSSPEGARQPPPVATPDSEQATMWMPREIPNPGGWTAPDERGWIAPDERQPLQPTVWQAPPPPVQVKPPSQSLAIASMITGLLGLLVGSFCLGPIPGVVALILGLVALSQIRKTPEQTGGKPFALVGVITGGLSILFYGALIIYFIVASIVFG